MQISARREKKKMAQKTLNCFPSNGERKKGERFQFRSLGFVQQKKDFVAFSKFSNFFRGKETKETFCGKFQTYLNRP